MRETKQIWSHFIEEGRFALHSYLTYLFKQCDEENLRQLEDENIKE